MHVVQELKSITGNMALLEYEIFAAAGNNLLLQNAQSFALGEKAVPQRSFDEGKELWPFEEEIWEDELNYFRSNMVNVCSKISKKDS